MHDLYSDTYDILCCVWVSKREILSSLKNLILQGISQYGRVIVQTKHMVLI